MRQQDPKVGDIWLSSDRNHHMLIVAVENENTTFTFRILEHGGEYMAGREWIKTHCLFYS